MAIGWIPDNLSFCNLLTMSFHTLLLAPLPLGLIPHPPLVHRPGLYMHPPPWSEAMFWLIMMLDRPPWSEAMFWLIMMLDRPPPWSEAIFCRSVGWGLSLALGLMAPVGSTRRCQESVSYVSTKYVCTNFFEKIENGSKCFVLQQCSAKFANVLAHANCKAALHDPLNVCVVVLVLMDRQHRLQLKTRRQRCQWPPMGKKLTVDGVPPAATNGHQ